jgi:hypothetical protein
MVVAMRRWQGGRKDDACRGKIAPLAGFPFGSGGLSGLG